MNNFFRGVSSALGFNPTPRLTEQRVVEIVKSEAEAYPFNRAPYSSGWSDRYAPPGEYRSQDAEENSAARACINWLVRALEAVPLRYYRGDTEIVGHPVMALLEKPNSEHNWNNFLYQIVSSLGHNGNCYITLLYDPELGLQVVPFQWSLLRLPSNPGEGLRLYVQSYGGSKTDFEEEEFVHLIWRPDPLNAYLGESPLKAAYREILLDRALTTSSIARMEAPHPSAIATPKAPDSRAPTKQELEAWAEEANKAKGDGAGRWAILGADYNVTPIPDHMKSFSYEHHYRHTESRIAAQFGVTASVAQLEVGLAHTRVGATMTREMQLAYTNGAIPLARLLEAELNRKLFPKLGYPDISIYFDFSGMDFMTEQDKESKSRRLIAELDKNLITREDYDREMGRGGNG